MDPSIGRILHYRLTADDAERINKRYEDAGGAMSLHRANATGVMVHVGNRVEAGEVVPIIVTQNFGDGIINAKAFLDGNDSLWLTSITEVDPSPTGEAGGWFWPPRVESAA